MTGKSRYERFRPAFAVVRFDGYQDPGSSPHVLFTVKEVLLSQEEAEAEVARLSAAHAERGGDPRVVYFAQYTRLTREGP